LDWVRLPFWARQEQCVPQTSRQCRAGIPSLTSVSLVEPPNEPFGTCLDELRIPGTPRGKLAHLTTPEIRS
jgi:hypothetical protein